MYSTTLLLALSFSVLGQATKSEVSAFVPKKNDTAYLGSRPDSPTAGRLFFPLPAGDKESWDRYLAITDKEIEASKKAEPGKASDLREAIDRIWKQHVTMAGEGKLFFLYANTRLLVVEPHPEFTETRQASPDPAFSFYPVECQIVSGEFKSQRLWVSNLQLRKKENLEKTFLLALANKKALDLKNNPPESEMAEAPQHYAGGASSLTPAYRRRIGKPVNAQREAERRMFNAQVSAGFNNAMANAPLPFNHTNVAQRMGVIPSNPPAYQNPSQYQNPYPYTGSHYCGATTLDGTPCMRLVAGYGFCYQHR